MSGGGGSLARLLHKYETLDELRQARARGEPIPDKAVFRALAEEFPGALYELDRLPIEDIAARREALAGALAGGPIEPWMSPMAAYHALYRAALFVKGRVGRGRDLGAEEASALARAASRHAALEIGSGFVRAAARPAAGRIGAAVIAEVAAREAVPEAALVTMLFPTRRDFRST